MNHVGSPDSLDSLYRGLQIESCESSPQQQPSSPGTSEVFPRLEEDVGLEGGSWGKQAATMDVKTAALSGRPFTAGQHALPDLLSGDVVLLLQKGQPYRVTPSQLPGRGGSQDGAATVELEGARLTHSLQLLGPASLAVSKQLVPPGAVELQQQLVAAGVQEEQCHLEVVRQGPFLGLRAPAAGWRFLQPRRHTQPPELLFFSLSCGVWEQWEVEFGSEAWQQPWSRMPVSLRSRRLPHVQLDVELVRAGSFTGRALPAPHPLGPPSLATWPALPEQLPAADQQQQQQQQAGGYGQAAAIAEPAMVPTPVLEVAESFTPLVPGSQGYSTGQVGQVVQVPRAAPLQPTLPCTAPHPVATSHTSQPLAQPGSKLTAAAIRQQQQQQGMRDGSFLPPSRPRSLAGSSAVRSTSWLPSLGVPQLRVGEHMSEDENLRQLSGALLHEMLRFANVEKSARSCVEGQVHDLAHQLDTLKLETLGQVEYLRAEMNTEIVALFNVVRAREAQLAAARAARRRMLTSAVAALWRRRALDTLTAVVCAWVSLTGRKRLWRSLVRQASARRAGRQLARVLQAWRGRVDASTRCAALLVKGMWRTCGRRQRQALRGWRGVVELHQGGRLCLQLLQQRLEQQVLGHALAAWLAMAQGKVSRRKRGLALWRRAQSRRLSTALAGWGAVVAQEHARREAALLLAMACQRAATARLLRAWAGRAAGCKSLVASGERLVRQHRLSLLKQCLGCWQSTINMRRAQAAVLARCSTTAQRRRCRAVLATWSAAARLAHHLRLQLGRLQQQQRRRQAAAVLAAWQHLAHRSLLGRQVLVHVQGHRKAAVLRQWAELAAAHGAGRRLLEGVERRRVAAAAAAALRAWLQFSDQAVLHRESQLGALQPSTLTCLRLGLGLMWRWACEDTALHAPLPPPLLREQWEWREEDQEQQQQQQQQLSPDPPGGLMTLVKSGPGPGADSWQSGRWLMAVAWSAWHTATADCCRVREVLGRHGRRQGRRRLAQCWQAWTRRVQEGQVAVAHADDLYQQHLHDVVSDALHAWYWVALTRRAHACLLARHVHQQAQARQQATLVAWAHAAQGSRSARQQAEALAAVRHQGLGRTALVGWQEAVAKSRAAAVLVAKVARCKLRMLLQAWTGLISFRHQGLANLQRSAAHHLLFSSFSAWLYAWHQGQAERQAVAKVEGWRAVRLQTLGVLLLRQHANQARRIRSCTQALLHRRLHGTLHRCMAAWSSLTRQAAASSRCTARLLGRWQHRQLARLWATWRSSWETSHVTGLHASTLAAQRQQRLLSSCLLAWSHLTSLCSAGRSQMMRMAQHHERCLLTSALHAWLQAAALLAAATQAAASLAAQHQHRLAGACLQAWQQLVRDLAQRRGAAELQGQSRDLQLLGYSMAAWTAHTRAACGWCMPVPNPLMQCQAPGSGLYHPNDPELQAGLLQAAGGVGASADPSTAHRGLPSTFDVKQAAGLAWPAVSTIPLMPRLALLLPAAQQRRSSCRLRACLLAWMVCATRSHWCQQAVLRAVGRRGARLQQAALWGWRGVAEERRWRRTAERRCMASRDRRRLKGSLTRWLEEARESRRRTEVLRACIKRKKVAFQLFKAWYWDSFSADVQVQCPKALAPLLEAEPLSAGRQFAQE